jgi:hypothetical protein
MAAAYALLACRAARRVGFEAMGTVNFCFLEVYPLLYVSPRTAWLGAFNHYE